MTYDGANRLVQTTDPLGGAEKLFYDANGRIVREMDAAGHERRRDYDVAGQLISRTDESQNVTTFAYDDAGRPICAIDPLGNVTQTVYDAMGNVIASIDALGNTTRYQYDPAGRQTAVIDALSHRTQTLYDPAGQVIATIDPLGYATSYAYDAAGRLAAITDALRGQALREYDPAGRLIAEADANGNTISHAYDPLGRMIRTIDPLGGLTLVSYDVSGKVTAVTDAAGATTRYVYDGAGRRSMEIDALGGRTRYEYDALGRLVQVTDPLGQSTMYEYDALSRPVLQTDPLGAATATTFSSTGQVQTITDDLGNVTQFQYDAAGRLTTRTDALGGQTRYEYDNVGNLLAEVDPLGRRTVYEYDAAYRMTAMVDAAGGRWRTAYDAADRVVRETDPLNSLSLTEYDALGRPVTRIDPLGRRTGAVYDKVGNPLIVTDPLGHATRTRYDAMNRAVTVIDALGGQTSVTYTPTGEVRTQTTPDGGITRFNYDRLDRMTAQIDPTGNVYSFAYDAAGRLVRQIDPLGYTQTFEFDAAGRQTAAIDALGNTTRYEYDSLGRPKAVTDPSGNRTETTYDALGRVIAETTSAGTRRNTYDAAGNRTHLTDRDGRITEYVYDSLNRPVLEQWFGPDQQSVREVYYGYDPVGRMTYAQDPEGQYNFAYDAAGQLTLYTVDLGHALPVITCAYAYDAAGSVLEIDESIGGNLVSVTSYEYDALARPTIITQTGATDKRADFGWSPASQLDTIARYAAMAPQQSGVETRYVRDAASRVTRLVHSAAGQSIASFEMVYDAVGRLVRKSVSGQVDQFTYDPTGQLRAAGPAGADQQYTYDANGNPAGASVQIGPGNRLLADDQYAYEYDAEGNRTRRTDRDSGQTTTYVYDHRSRLVRVSTADARGTLLSQVDYGYDALNRQVYRAADADGAGPAAAEVTHDIHRGDQLTLTLDATGQVVRRCVNGPVTDLVVFVECASDGLLLPLADEQRTVYDVAAADGTVLDHRTYDGFGAMLAGTDAAVDCPPAYTARPLDTLTGLYNYRARWYDPAAHRFLSEDPTGFDGGDVNLYRYVLNSPTNFVDPTGRKRVDLTRYNDVGYIKTLDYDQQVFIRQVMRARIDEITGTVAMQDWTRTGVLALKGVGDFAASLPGKLANMVWETPGTLYHLVHGAVEVQFDQARLQHRQALENVKCHFPGLIPDPLYDILYDSAAPTGDLGKFQELAKTDPLAAKALLEIQGTMTQEAIAKWFQHWGEAEVDERITMFLDVEFDAVMLADAGMSLAKLAKLRSLGKVGGAEWSGTIAELEAHLASKGYNAKQIANAKVLLEEMSDISKADGATIATTELKQATLANLDDLNRISKDLNIKCKSGPDGYVYVNSAKDYKAIQELTAEGYGVDEWRRVYKIVDGEFRYVAGDVDILGASVNNKLVKESDAIYDTVANAVNKVFNKDVITHPNKVAAYAPTNVLPKINPSAAVFVKGDQIIFAGNKRQVAELLAEHMPGANRFYGQQFILNYNPMAPNISIPYSGMSLLQATRSSDTARSGATQAPSQPSPTDMPLFSQVRIQP